MGKSVQRSSRRPPLPAEEHAPPTLPKGLSKAAQGSGTVKGLWLRAPYLLPNDERPASLLAERSS